MHSPRINGEGELRGNRLMAVKMECLRFSKRFLGYYFCPLSSFFIDSVICRGVVDVFLCHRVRRCGVLCDSTSAMSLLYECINTVIAGL